MARSTPSALLCALLLVSPALAQGGGLPPGMGMPSKEQIRERVYELIDRSPVKKLEIKDLIKVEYKQVPTNPEKIAKQLGDQYKSQLPKGITDQQIQGFIKQYMPEITTALNEGLADFGTVHVLQPLKVKKKTLKKGKWRLGMAFKGEKPQGFVLRGSEDLPEKERVFTMKVKTRGTKLQDELTLLLKEPKKQKEGEFVFDIQVGFLRYDSKTKYKLERTEAEPEE